MSDRDRVTNIVRVNTGSSAQPTTMVQFRLEARLLDLTSWDRDRIKREIATAIKEDRLFAWREPDEYGNMRTWLCHTDEEHIRALIGAENEKDTPDTELIEAAAEYL